MTPTEIMKAELLKKLATAHPSFTQDSLESLATALIESKAYGWNGSRVVPTGDRGAVARAFQIDPAFVGLISSEHVKASSANSSIEQAPLARAAARLQAMGIDMDRALEGDTNDGDTFYGFSQAEIDNMGPKGAA